MSLLKVKENNWKRIISQHQLFLSQKQTLDSFLERGAISKLQYEKSLHDLRVKMSEMDEDTK